MNGPVDCYYDGQFICTSSRKFVDIIGLSGYTVDTVISDDKTTFTAGVVLDFTGVPEWESLISGVSNSDINLTAQLYNFRVDGNYEWWEITKDNWEELSEGIYLVKGTRALRDAAADWLNNITFTPSAAYVQITENGIRYSYGIQFVTGGKPNRVIIATNFTDPIISEVRMDV